MSKKKNDLSDFADIFKDMKKDTEEVEALLAQAKGEAVVEDIKEPVKVKEAAPAEVLAKAFGVHKDTESGQWCVAEVHFNPLTGEARVHNDRVITNLSKAVIGVRAQELMTRAHNGLSLKHAKGYKG